MALISEKKFIVNTLNGNGCNNVGNQINYFSQTSLLNARIEFKSEKDISSDSSDEDGAMSVQKLKSKYHVLIPETSSDNANKGYSSGFFPNLKQNKTTSQLNKDGNELGEPKHILYPREKIILEWKRINKIGSGLHNLGNTCFMNSVLQCLTYCPPLVNYLYSIKDEHSDKCRQNFCMICLMLKHVSLTRNCQVLKPLYICQRLKSIAKHFTFGRQEDAHEFLRYVIDHMWRSCLSVHEHEFGISGMASKFDQLTKATTAINQIFGGYHRSQVLCMQCKEKSNTYDYFMDFMLDIQNVSSLEEALQKFVTPEILKNENAYKCSKCKKSVVAKKQFTVHKAPNVATFQFKRFDCSRMFGKITKAVSYPEKLNLRPYMSEKGPPLMYKLISVLVHFGSSSSSGHYYCYVRNSNNCWYIMDDSQVNQVSLSEVLNQKAYVLLYIRLPPENVPNQKLSPQQNINAQNKSTNNSLNTINFKQNSNVFNSNFKFSPNGINLEKLKNGNNLNSVVKNDTNIPSATSIKLNIKNSTSENNITKKTNVLVPYDEDSDDGKREVIKTNIERVSERNDSKTSDKENCKDKLSTNPSKTNHVNGKEAIPILKVKATTNSWQVVEAHNDKSSDDKRNHKLTSNWKISKINNHDRKDNNPHESGLPNSDVNKLNYEKTYSSKNKDKSYKSEEFIEKLSRKKDKKEKKKKRKKKDKEKSKKKKRNSSEESDDSDFDSSELNWVERTKETLEMEKKIDVTEKRKLEDTCSESSNGSLKKTKVVSDESSKKMDILDALLKNASRGYSENVKSWDGGVSNLNKSLSEDNRNMNSADSDEEYNEEFDRGKIKKIKIKTDKFDMLKAESGNGNPFQRAQQSKYASNSFSENGHSQSSFSSKTSKTNKFNFQSNSNRSSSDSYFKEKYSDKPIDKFSSSKNFHNHNHYNNNYKSNSNSFHKSKNFKCR